MTPFATGLEGENAVFPPSFLLDGCVDSSRKKSLATEIPHAHFLLC